MIRRLILLGMVLFCGAPAFAQRGAKEKIDFLVHRIKERNALTVYYQEKDVRAQRSPLTYKTISPSEYDKLLTYMAILQCELNKMPKQMVINSGLKTICLVKDLSHGNQKASGVAHVTIMFLDCFSPNDDEKRHVLHHEFFHILDKAYNGLDATKSDEAWNALNEPDFKYTKNIDATVTRWYSGYIDHPQKGFVNKYSMSSPGEDKAEIYSALCMDDQAKTLDGWARSDEILARKIKYIRKFCIAASKPRDSVKWPSSEPNTKN